MEYGPLESIVWSRADPVFYKAIRYITVFAVALPLDPVLAAKSNLYCYIEFVYYQF